MVLATYIVYTLAVLQYASFLKTISFISLAEIVSNWILKNWEEKQVYHSSGHFVLAWKPRHTVLVVIFRERSSITSARFPKLWTSFCVIIFSTDWHVPSPLIFETFDLHVRAIVYALGKFILVQWSFQLVRFHFHFN